MKLIRAIDEHIEEYLLIGCDDDTKLQVITADGSDPIFDHELNKVEITNISGDSFRLLDALSIDELLAKVWATQYRCWN